MTIIKAHTNVDSRAFPGQFSTRLTLFILIKYLNLCRKNSALRMIFSSFSFCFSPSLFLTLPLLDYKANTISKRSSKLKYLSFGQIILLAATFFSWQIQTHKTVHNLNFFFFIFFCGGLFKVTS